MKKTSKILAVSAVIVLITFAIFLEAKWDAVFQRGNPIPYLSAMVKLSDENPFVAVEDMDGVYVTRRGDKLAFFEMICDTYGVELQDQIGSSFVFTDGENIHAVSSEIYWGRFTVWMLSFDKE